MPQHSGQCEWGAGCLPLGQKLSPIVVAAGPAAATDNRHRQGWPPHGNVWGLDAAVLGVNSSYSGGRC